MSQSNAKFCFGLFVGWTDTHRNRLSDTYLQAPSGLSLEPGSPLGAAGLNHRMALSRGGAGAEQTHLDQVVCSRKWSCPVTCNRKWFYIRPGCLDQTSVYYIQFRIGSDQCQLSMYAISVCEIIQTWGDFFRLKMFFRGQVSENLLPPWVKHALVQKLWWKQNLESN